MSTAPKLNSIDESAKKIYYFALPIITDWLFIIASIILAIQSESILILILSVLIIGIHQHRIVILGHEATHYNFIPKNKKLNDLFANTFIFFPLGASIGSYRSWHFRHHKHLGTSEDPETLYKTGWKYSLPMTKKKSMLIFVHDLLGLGAPKLLQLIFILRPRGREAIYFSAFWCLVIFALLSIPQILALWFISLLTAFSAIFTLRNYSEHLGYNGTHRFVPFLRYAFFPYNTWCHHEHHRHPGLPWWSLAMAFRKNPVTQDLWSALNTESK